MGTRPGLNHPILKFAIFFRQLCRNASPGRHDSDRLLRRRIFCHIRDISVVQRFLRCKHEIEIPRFHKSAHGLRHASRHKIFPVQIQSRIMKRQRRKALISFPDHFSHRLLADCPQKFFKIQRIQSQPVYLTDRKRKALPLQCHTKQTSRRNNVVFRSVFTKIFQGGKRPLTCLNFIKNNQGISRKYRCSGFDRQFPDQASDIEIPLKNRLDFRRVLHIEIDRIFILLLPEGQRRIGFSNLSGSVQQKRHASGILLPGPEPVHQFSFHKSVYHSHLF